jgi:hypothetical protein
MRRNELDALLLLSRLAPLVHTITELPNGYWPKGLDYDEIRLSSPWWRLDTKLGPIVIGWRKRVLEINWIGTPIRGHMTGPDDVTSITTYCHAWDYGHALIYLTNLRRALELHHEQPERSA